MFFNKPPGGGLFGLPFSQQINNFDALTSSSQPQKLLPGEWDWQKKKPPIVDLITGLANMFGKPADTPEFTLQQPTFGLPTTTPPYVAQPPQDKTGWGDWMGNWGLQRPDLGDLPQYPSPNDPFALGKQTGDMIRKTWHDVHKDYAFNTIQENFPDLDISQPQPDQSYHDFFDGIKRQIDAMPSHLLAAMQRADSSEASDDPELDRRQPPYPDWPKDQMPPSPFDPMLRNFLIFISSLILFLDCWKSLRSSSTWHDRATNTTTEIVSSVDSRDRGLAILYLCAFGYVAWISTRTNRYVDWLSQYTDSMNSEQIQQQKNMVQLAHAVIQSTIYSSLTIVIIGLLFLCKSFLFNKVNVRKNWILRREAYLAIGAFLMPALLIMLTVGFSLYILYEQNQALINSIPR